MGSSVSTIENEQPQPPPEEEKPTAPSEAPAAVSEGQSLPLAFRSAKRWSSRTQSIQLFGAVRHTSRADLMGAVWQGGSWLESSDFRTYPLDPPLSDEGREEATEVAERVVDFLHSRPGAHLQVVISSPYLRCVETAVALCQRLGGTRLMIDLGLGEVYGPEIFGDIEPGPASVRSLEELEAYFRRVWKVEGFPAPVSVVGRWPRWPEGLSSGRKRYAERLLAYLNRGEKARRNFLLVSHADCLASALALMPAEGGRVVESVGYGGMMMACRMTLPVLLGSPASRKSSTCGDEEEARSPSRRPSGFDECTAPCESPVAARVPASSTPCRLATDQRAWWGQEMPEESPSGQLRINTDSLEDEEELFLSRFRQVPWQMEVWNVKLGHQWCDGAEHAVAQAMAALQSHGKKKSGPVIKSKVEQLLGVLSKETLASTRSLSGRMQPVNSDSSNSELEFQKVSSHLSTVSYETFLFGCSHTSLPEARAARGREERIKASECSSKLSVVEEKSKPRLLPGLVPKLGQSRLMQRRQQSCK